jgi:hypothetical protein
VLISIYPVARGEHREMQAHADIAASGPFDSPDVIAGQLVNLPGDATIPELEANEVLYEGEVYRFRVLAADGTFELRKAW